MKPTPALPPENVSDGPRCREHRVLKLARAQYFCEECEAERHAEKHSGDAPYFVQRNDAKGETLVVTGPDGEIGIIFAEEHEADAEDLADRLNEAYAHGQANPDAETTTDDHMRCLDNLLMLGRRILAHPHKAAELAGHIVRFAMEGGAVAPGLLREAAPPAPTPPQWCHAESPDPRPDDDPSPFVCTLPFGHAGEHVAEDIYNQVKSRWTATP